MTAIGYVRVSTEDQAEEGMSLDNQRSKITAYCRSKENDPTLLVSGSVFEGEILDGNVGHIAQG